MLFRELFYNTDKQKVLICDKVKTTINGKIIPRNCVDIETVDSALATALFNLEVFDSAEQGDTLYVALFDLDSII